MSNLSAFNGYQPTWCPGCGDWSIGIAIKTALAQMGFTPSDLIVVFGIGCSGNMNDFLNAYAVHGLHGRGLANAIGAKIANHKLPVVVVAGDGDTYGEGGNHFLHACRGNHDLTVIIHDNSVYGLTTGQVSPTAHQGAKSKSTPYGLPEQPVRPLHIALTQGASFVAQAFAGKVPQMIELIKQAINHRGFSVVNILQPCVTFNKLQTYQYYLQRTFDLDENHNKTDLKSVLSFVQKAYEEERFPLGVLYQVEKPVYTDFLQVLKDSTLVDKEKDTKAVAKELLKEFL